MNSANRSTLTMLVLALVSAAVAMYYFPWPELVETDDEIGQLLFEDYSANRVRGIEIVKFDGDNNTVDRIKLKRRGEKWVIPAKQNFIASQSKRIGAVIRSLNERTIFDVISEDQEDHIEFGVVDPASYSGEDNAAAFGQKLELTDRNNNSIASLIIGSALKNTPTQRYVRIPGKPRVYTIEFDSEVLTTEFPQWVSTNALQLRSPDNPDGHQIREIRIDNYRVNATNQQQIEPRPIYRATLRPQEGKLVVRALQLPTVKDSVKAWKTLPTTPEQEVKLKSCINPLIYFFVNDVRRKKKELGAALKNPSSKVKSDVFSNLPSLGFFPQGLQDGEWRFESANGQVEVAIDKGVVVTISIGTVGSADASSTGKLNHYVMINATVDRAFLKKPQRPQGLADDESQENKEFRRLLDRWQKSVKQAERVARDLNAIHGDWYYLVSDKILDILRPEIPLPALSSPVSGPSPNAVDGSGTAQEPESIAPAKSDAGDGNGSSVEQDKEDS